MKFYSQSFGATTPSVIRWIATCIRWLGMRVPHSHRLTVTRITPSRLATSAWVIFFSARHFFSFIIVTPWLKSSMDHRGGEHDTRRNFESSQTVRLGR